MPLTDKQDIQTAYRDTGRVAGYIAERFERPLGRVQHARQVAFVHRALLAWGCRRVLEIAPGPARLTARLAGVFRGVALDFSPEMLRCARARLARSDCGGCWSLVRGDAFCLPFAADSFDAVYTFRFVRHFEAEGRGRLLREIRRVLRPRGVYITDYENAPPGDCRDGDARGAGADLRERNPAGWIFDARLTAGEVRRELDAEGFDLLELRGNIRHPRLQGQFDRKPSWGLMALRRLAVRCIECIPGKEPLEWLVLGRKR
jgi:SAM-dependent methyltransferase